MNSVKWSPGVVVAHFDDAPAEKPEPRRTQGATKVLSLLSMAFFLYLPMVRAPWLARGATADGDSGTAGHSQPDDQE